MTQTMEQEYIIMIGQSLREQLQRMIYRLESII